MIPVTRRDGSQHVILFDDTDAELVLQHRWFIRERTPSLFYVRLADGRRRLLNMHSLLLGPDADHINHNGLDNRRENLRLATRAQQAANRRPYAGRGFKGVSPVHGRFIARIKQRYIGTFDTPEEAAAAYDREAKALWGDYACLNGVSA